MKIPLVDLARQNVPLLPQIEAVLKSHIERSDFILGKAVKEFEQAFAAHTGTAHAVGCSSGTDALYLALAALDIGPGHEVITTPFTFSATVSAIMRTGAKPVLVDIEPETYTINPKYIEMAITEKTKAIIPVHIYGQAADMEAIQSIAKRRRIAVIEDCAQAHGATWKGQRVGSMGAISAFSFFPSKNLSAIGDAGACTTNDDELAARMSRLRVHGRADKHESLEIGANARIDTVQAAVLAIKLPHLDRWNDERRRIAKVYDEELAGDARYVRPVIGPHRGHVYHIYSIQSEDRAKVVAALEKEGIGCGVHYPMPVHFMKAYASLGYGRGDCPIAERICQRILSLPIFPGMTDDEARTVAGVLKKL